MDANLLLVATAQFEIFVDFLYIFAYNKGVGSVKRQATCVCFFATCAAGGDVHGKNH